MKRYCWFAILFIALSCDSTRLYEQNTDIEDAQWNVKNKPSFEFRVRDLGKRYNLYCNLRNSSDYPYARFFFNYYLKDSAGTVISKELKSIFLFDAKTGKPFGTSGIGDVFDHQVSLIPSHEFKYRGRYTVEFEQNMRLDTLAGIKAIGLRVEEVKIQSKQ